MNCDRRKKKRSVSANSTDLGTVYQTARCYKAKVYSTHSLSTTSLGRKFALMLAPVHFACRPRYKAGVPDALLRALRVGAVKNPASDIVMGEASAYQEDNGSGTRGSGAYQHEVT